MSRVNLGLHQSDVSVVWDLARTTSRSSATGWTRRRRRQRDLRRLRASPTSRTSPSSISSSARGRSPTSSSPGSRRASCGARRSSAREDGRLRRHEQRAGAGLRLGRDAPEPETFGEFRLTYRTGDIVSPHVGARSRCCSSSETSARDPDGANRARRQAGLEVVRMIEAVDRSLEEEGARVEVALGSRLPTA